jgi:hypothetical protein
LTVLTLMLAILMFVVGPLQAAGIVAAHHFGLAFGLVLMAAVFIVSGSPVSLVAMLIAIALIVVSTLLRVRHPSVLDIYLDAAARLIAGVTLSIVVSRAVFSPGPITFHRVVGAILLYLNIGMIPRGVVLLRRPARAQRFRRPWSAAGQSRRRRKFDLFQLRYADLGGLWRHCALAPVRARPFQCGSQ